jgi:hypothetical protein
MACNPLKTIIVDPYTPVFQKSHINYCDEAFYAFMEYSEMKPKTLDEYIEILKNIERKFVFRVYNSISPTEDPWYPKLDMILGNIRLRKPVRRFSDDGIEMFRAIFESFLELLASYVDLVGEKPSILRDKGDAEHYNRVLEKYLHDYVRNNWAESRKDCFNRNPIKTQRPTNKIKRQYGLDDININDDVYKEVINWIESRRDFILIDYNNMSGIY